MKRPILLTVLLLLAIVISSVTPAVAREGLARPLPQASNDSRSAAQGTAMHKAIAAPGVLDPARSGVTLWHDYGAFALYRVSDEALARLSPAARSQVLMDPQMDTILFDRHPSDTRSEKFDLPEALIVNEPDGAALQLVQFVGPIQQAWLDAVVAAGGTPIQYLANNAYLVWADTKGRSQLGALAAQGDFLQFSSPYQPAYKLGASIEKRIVEKSNPEEIVPVDIQVYHHAGQKASQTIIEGLAVERLSAWSPILAFENIAITLRASDLLAVARLNDVVWIGERFKRELNDEVQGQILAAHFDGAKSGPSGAGYKAWLDGLGFSQDPAAYPVVGLADDGVGTGSVTNGAGDVTLTKLGDGVTTRLAFAANCTTDASADGVAGHGHINTSIVGGYDTRTGFPFQDPLGYQRGQGINPYGRMAQTKIFKNGGTYNITNCGGTDTGVIKSEQDNGALVSSNSWGCAGCAGTYDTSSQAYDVGVRDADLTEAGNQPMVYVFSAGNSGSGSSTIGTPGNGKNMITVGASENDRASDEDGSWTDGCGIGPTGADNAMDVISFSSRGPAPGGRVKPEVIAPGTHIQGTASTNGSYDGSGVCDKYRPSGQTTFAASSGTSHSTPAVAGVSSLYCYWLQHQYGLATPSPALIKSYLLAHPTYLTGVSANDTLPSNSQGYGMPDMSTAFDNAPRVLVNQTTIFGNTGETWTWTGSVADSSKPLRIVMAYTDAAGAVGTSPQVNDLNLTAVVNGTTYLGNHFSGQWSTAGGTADTANNYEAIFLPAGTTGSLSMTITAFNIAGDGVPNSGDATDQDFALVCYNCLQTPDFSVVATPTTQGVCAPADAVVNVAIGSLNAFVNPVTLAASGNPAGTTVGFSVNPVTPPGTSALTIGNTGAAAAGSYTIVVTGTAGSTNHTGSVRLDLSIGTPAGPALVSPANAATNVATTPTFSWNAVAGASSYTLEIATDPTFVTIAISASGLTGTSYTPPAPLNTGALFYWRVRAISACGTSPYAAVFHFSTAAAAGDCSVGATPNVLLSQGFEAGAGGWTHSAATGTDTWAIWGANVHSGSAAFHANDPTTRSDQRLVSPAAALPAGQSPLTLRFWNRQVMQSRPGGCYDGGILEVSTDSGSNWTQVTTGLLTDPYNGRFSSGNPLGTVSAWCGDPQDWLNSVVSLDTYAGQSAQFRFRLGSNASVSREGWTLDDVVVQSCQACVAPATVTGVTISRSGGSQVQVAWSAAAGATYYEVWYTANQPYFTPGADCGNPAPYGCAYVAGSSFMHASVGDPAQNYSYVIRAGNACAAVSPALSGRVGEFDYGLMPGD